MGLAGLDGSQDLRRLSASWSQQQRASSPLSEARAGVTLRKGLRVNPKTWTRILRPLGQPAGIPSVLGS